MLGGVVYGLAAGLLLQCVVVSLAFGGTSRLSWSPARSPGKKIMSWLAAELVVIPLSVVMTTAAHGVPVLLAWMLL